MSNRGKNEEMHAKNLIISFVILLLNTRRSFLSVVGPGMYLFGKHGLMNYYAAITTCMFTETLMKLIFDQGLYLHRPIIISSLLAFFCPCFYSLQCPWKQQPAKPIPYVDEIQRGKLGFFPFPLAIWYNILAKNIVRWQRHVCNQVTWYIPTAHIHFSSQLLCCTCKQIARTGTSTHMSMLFCFFGFVVQIRSTLVVVVYYISNVGECSSKGKKSEMLGRLCRNHFLELKRSGEQMSSKSCILCWNELKWYRR